MHANNMLAPEQFGFRKIVATEDAAIQKTDHALRCVKPKMHIGGIFCD
jgi:hypothetical protein